VLGLGFRDTTGITRTVTTIRSGIITGRITAAIIIGHTIGATVIVITGIIQTTITSTNLIKPSWLEIFRASLMVPSTTR
jgi:hypothetical protein